MASASLKGGRRRPQQGPPGVLCVAWHLGLWCPLGCTRRGIQPEGGTSGSRPPLSLGPGALPQGPRWLRGFRALPKPRLMPRRAEGQGRAQGASQGAASQSPGPEPHFTRKPPQWDPPALRLSGRGPQMATVPSLFLVFAQSRTQAARPKTAPQFIPGLTPSDSPGHVTPLLLYCLVSVSQIKITAPGGAGMMLA